MNREDDCMCVSCGKYVVDGEQICPICKKQEQEPKLKISESLIIEMDISFEKDISVLQILRNVNGHFYVINTLYDKEAEETYFHLINEQHRIKVFDKILNNKGGFSKWNQDKH